MFAHVLEAIQTHIPTELDLETDELSSVMVIRVAPNLFDLFYFILAHPTRPRNHVTRRHGFMTCTIT